MKSGKVLMHAKALGKEGGIIAQTREGLGTSRKTVLALEK